MAIWPGLDLQMITMNMGTSNKDTGPSTRSKQAAIDTAVDIRRRRVSVYWNEVKPDIVFSQDISDAPNWSLDVSGSYKYLNEGKETGIAYNSDILQEVIHIDKNEKKKIPAEFDDRERLCVAVLLHKKTHLKLLCVSWHGRNNALTGGALAIRPRQIGLTALLHFMQALQAHSRSDAEYHHDAVVIAGDFNIKANLTILQDDFQLLSPCYEKVDYFLYKGFRQNPRVIGGSYADNTQPGYLDHNPVKAVFSLTASGVAHQPCIICYKDFDPPWLLEIHVHEDCLQKYALDNGRETCPACKRDFILPVLEHLTRLRWTELLLPAMPCSEKPQYCEFCDDGEKPLEKWCQQCGMFLCGTCCYRIHDRLRDMALHEPQDLPTESNQSEPTDEQATMLLKLNKLVEILVTQETKERAQKLELTKRLKEIDLWLARLPLLIKFNKKVQEAGNTFDLFHVIECVNAANSGSSMADDTVLFMLLCGVTGGKAPNLIEESNLDENLNHNEEPNPNKGLDPIDGHHSPAMVLSLPVVQNPDWEVTCDSVRDGVACNDLMRVLRCREPLCLRICHRKPECSGNGTHHRNDPWFCRLHNTNGPVVANPVEVVLPVACDRDDCNTRVPLLRCAEPQCNNLCHKRAGCSNLTIHFMNKVGTWRCRAHPQIP